MICSGCRGTELHRSRTRWYEYILRPFNLRPYRCISCYRRTLRFADKATEAAAMRRPSRSKPAA